MFLWYMVSLDKYVVIVDWFGISESIVLYVIYNFIIFINDYLLDVVILWFIFLEMYEIKDMYLEFKGFFDIIGFIDGIYILIKRLLERGIDYYNCKDFYLIVL